MKVIFQEIIMIRVYYGKKSLAYIKVNSCLWIVHCTVFSKIHVLLSKENKEKTLLNTTMDCIFLAF